MKLPNPRRIIESAGFYPLTSVYLAGVAIAFLVVKGIMQPFYGVILFSVAVVVAILAADHRELKKVQRKLARLENGGAVDPKRSHSDARKSGLAGGSWPTGESGNPG